MATTPETIPAHGKETSVASVANGSRPRNNFDPENVTARALKIVGPAVSSKIFEYDPTPQKNAMPEPANPEITTIA